MTDLNNATVIKCPWCHNSLNIIQSGKSGLHYANCGSCNAHFLNIPLTGFADIWYGYYMSLRIITEVKL